MKVKGLKNDYVITNSQMLEGEIISTDKFNAKIKVLKHNIPAYEGKIFGVGMKDDEFEIITKIPKKQKQQFCKKDLRVGDRVTRRDGNTYIYDGYWIGGLDKPKINEDLTNAGTMKEAFDIVKVERAVKYEIVFERKEEILDEVEKRYLTEVIRPFRNRIKFIIKKLDYATFKREYIYICLNGEGFFLPWFKVNTKYKGMIVDVAYSLEELGL